MTRSATGLVARNLEALAAQQAIMTTPASLSSSDLSTSNGTLTIAASAVAPIAAEFGASLVSVPAPATTAMAPIEAASQVPPLINTYSEVAARMTAIAAATVSR